MSPAPIAPIAISLGDPSGVGPEVVAKCWDHRSAFNLPVFLAVGGARSLATVWDGPIVTIDDPRDADSAFDVGLPLIHIASAENEIPGQPTVSGAHCSLDSLEIAVGLARSVSASAVVTGPVSKHQLYRIGFAHPGQTEFVAERCGVASENVAMMLAGPSLRTVPVTTHLPFREVPLRLSASLIEARGRRHCAACSAISDRRPQLAVAGLTHTPAKADAGHGRIDIITRHRRLRARLDRHRPLPPTPCSTKAPALATTPLCACIMTRP